MEKRLLPVRVRRGRHGERAWDQRRGGTRGDVRGVRVGLSQVGGGAVPDPDPGGDQSAAPGARVDRPRHPSLQPVDRGGDAGFTTLAQRPRFGPGARVHHPGREDARGPEGQGALGGEAVRAVPMRLVASGAAKRPGRSPRSASRG